jgi:hypothetical protein
MIAREDINKKKELSMFTALSILFLMAVVIALLFSGKLTIVGMQILGLTNYTTHTQEVNLTFTSTQEYVWNITDAPESFNLRAVMLDGEVIGKGNVRATLIAPDGERYLILKSSKIGKEKITGMQIFENATENNSQTSIIAEDDSLTGNITDGGFAQNDTENVPADQRHEEKSIKIKLDYQRGTRWDPNDDGTAATEADAVDFTVAETKFSWDADTSKLCTRWTITSQDTGSSTTLCNGNAECCGLVGVAHKEETWDAPLYVYYEQYGTTLDNTVSAQVIYLDQSLDVADTHFDSAQSGTETLAARFETVARKEFSGECVESCLLPAGLNATSYKILFEIEEGTTLIIDGITYSIEDLTLPNETFTLNPEVTDSKGNVLPSTVEVRKKHTLEKVAEKRIERRARREGRMLAGEPRPNAVRLARGEYAIAVDLTEANIPIKRIELSDTTIANNSAGFLRAEEVNITDTASGYVKMYAIDPTAVNFTNATVTVVATGTELYKCREWDFDTQTCKGEWTKIMDITPGSEYTFELTPEDPGYAETGTRGAWLAYYNTTNPTLPKWRTWNGTISAAGNASDTGTSADAEWVVLRSSPVRDEKILATLDDLGEVKAQAWNVSAQNWTPATNISTAIGTTNDAYRGLDVAYEQNSGRAMVVASNGTANAVYNIWNGTAWEYATSQVMSTDGCTGTVIWVVLKSKPNSNELLVVEQDSNADYCARIWNGTAWINNSTLDTAPTTSTTQRFDAAYEQQSGDAIIAWEKQTTAGLIWYATYSGGIWGTPASSGRDVGLASLWIKAASMRGSNRVMFGTIENTATYTMNALEWNGTAWGTNASLDRAIETTAGYRFMDVAYIGTNGSAIAVYADADSDIPYYRTCTNATNCFAGTWVAATNTTATTNYCGSAAADIGWIGLDPDPRSDRIFLWGKSQTNFGKCFQEYNGTAWKTWQGNLGNGAILGTTEDVMASADWFNDTTGPTVTFVAQTPPDGANQTTSTVTINVTASETGTFIASCNLTDNNSFFWLTGYNTGKVYKYDTAFNYTGISINLHDITPGYLATPFRCRDITKGANGNWYITENLNRYVYEYTPSWTYVATHTETRPQQNMPDGVWQGLDGKWYQVGYNPSKVFEYSSSWVYSGTSYDISGTSTWPQSIYQKPNGVWLIAEKGWVYEFSSSFVYTGTRHALTYGSPVMHGNNAYGLTTDASGRWYVTDIDDDAVNVYSPSWEYMGSHSTLAQDGIMTGIYYDKSETNNPNVTNLLTNNTIYGINDTVLITARVVDDTSVENVTSNVTLPNSTVFVVQMTYNILTNRYQGDFNTTDLLGTYTARIIARDSNGNVNDSQTTSFKIVRPYLNITKNDTPDPVQVGQYIDYSINYTVNKSSGGIVLLDFQDFKFVTSNNFPEDSPQLVETQAGTLLIIYHAMPGTNNDIYAVRSTDKGATWGSPIQATNEVEEDTYPNVFVDTDGTILVTYSHETVAGYNDVWMINSSNDGITWSEPFAVTTTPTISEWEPVIDKDSNGTYYIPFEAVIAPDTDTEIYILNSSDLYGSWPDRTQMTNNSYMDVDIELAIVDNMFYFAWAPAYPDYQQIWFAKTTNPLVYGVLDSNKTQVTDNHIYNYETSVNRDFYGNVYIGWVGMVNVSDVGEPNWNRTSNEVFLASSYDDGNEWDVRRITNNNVSDSYPGIVQTRAGGLYYISALRTNGTELDVTFAQRVFSPEDTISAIIDDKIPPNTSVTNIGQGGTLIGDMIRWTFPTIYAGNSGQVTFRVKVNETVKNGTIINNTANATYYNTNNQNMGLVNSSANTTAIDTLNPNVTIVLPVPASTYPQYSNVPIKVNVTDNGLVSNVTANISIPGDGWQLVNLTYNATSLLYEGNFSGTATIGQYNLTILANDTTGNKNDTATTHFFITNSPPTTPTNLTCNGGSCAGSFSGSINLNCSGSTDPDLDAMTYHVEALYAESRGNKTHLNVTFEAGNDSFAYYDDLYNTSSPTQAVGQRVTSANCTSGSCLNVQLNLNTPVTGTNISGGWNRSVNITNAPTYLNITFSYKMRLSDSTEPADNISIWYRDMNTGLGATGPQLIGITGTDFVDEYQTGTVTIRQYAVYNSTKTFDFGCRLYATDATDENGECWLDNLNITAVNTSDMPQEWHEIGTHTNTTTLLWNIYNEKPQTSVDFRCRAIDTGSLTYSAYYTIGANATILLDTKPPWWYNNLTKPTSPATYIFGGPYQFNISWEDNGVINTTRIEHNFTGTLANYSFSAQNGYEYIYNYANLPVGTYRWKSYANDSAGNKNESDVFTFQVVQAPTNTTIYVNGTAADYTRNVSFTANITCVANVSGNVNITENSTQIAYGASPLQTTRTYTTLGQKVINCTYYANQNYTGSNSTRNIYAIDSIPPILTLNQPPINYYNDTNNTVMFNCSATDNYALKNITLYITDSSNTSFAPYQTNPLTGTANSTSWTLILAQGNYTWNCLGYDNEGNSAFATANRTIKINYTAFVPSVGFSVTLPGKVPVNASAGGNATATMMFNSTLNTYYNMEPCVQGTTDCQNATTPFFIYLNTGNVNLTINVSLDTNLPAMFNLTVNTVRNNATATRMNTTPVNIVTNMLPGATQDAYFFGSFINAFPADSTTRTLGSNGTQST